MFLYPCWSLWRMDLTFILGLAPYYPICVCQHRLNSPWIIHRIFTQYSIRCPPTGNSETTQCTRYEVCWLLQPPLSLSPDSLSCLRYDSTTNSCFHSVHIIVFMFVTAVVTLSLLLLFLCAVVVLLTAVCGWVDWLQRCQLPISRLYSLLLEWLAQWDNIVPQRFKSHSKKKCSTWKTNQVQSNLDYPNLSVIRTH